MRGCSGATACPNRPSTTACTSAATSLVMGFRLRPLPPRLARPPTDTAHGRCCWRRPIFGVLVIEAAWLARKACSASARSAVRSAPKWLARFSASASASSGSSSSSSVARHLREGL